MPLALKALTVLGGIGMATAVLLPQRQTVAVLDQIRRLITGSFGTVISGKAS